LFRAGHLAQNNLRIASADIAQNAINVIPNTSELHLEHFQEMMQRVLLFAIDSFGLSYFPYFDN
jgi:hypothetical protein